MKLEATCTFLRLISEVPSRRRQLEGVGDHKLAPPLPAISTGDVSGKVRSTLITTQQAGIYPKSLLGFAIYLVSLLHDIRGHMNVPVAYGSRYMGT